MLFNCHKSRRFSVSPDVRVTKMKPNLKPGEVPIYIRMNIPDALFTRPSLSADIVIPDDVVKDQISADVISDVKDIVRKELDLKLNVKVAFEEDDDVDES